MFKRFGRSEKVDSEPEEEIMEWAVCPNVKCPSVVAELKTLTRRSTFLNDLLEKIKVVDGKTVLPYSPGYKQTLTDFSRQPRKVYILCPICRTILEEQEIRIMEKPKLPVGEMPSPASMMTVTEKIVPLVRLAEPEEPIKILKEELAPKSFIYKIYPVRERMAELIFMLKKNRDDGVLNYNVDVVGEANEVTIDINSKKELDLEKLKSKNLISRFS